LADFLARAASLGRALPNTAQLKFEQRVSDELATLPDAARGTEVERMVRQRVGQDAFRQAMLDYWGSACAVTGIAIPEILRASHAKPWAECLSDAERLDVFNGFLLSANLDALFDRGLISFDSLGGLLVSGQINDEEKRRLRLDCQMSLRWLAEEHLSYLAWHRHNLFDKS